MYITPNKQKQLTKELESLQKLLPALIKETGEMASLGDRSENAGYINAKQNMRKTQSRIMYLENTLKKATIINNKHSSKVQIGSTVQLLNLNDNKKYTYTIVDSIEANPTNGFISFYSPLGNSLLGKIKEQEVNIVTNHFSTKYKIISID